MIAAVPWQGGATWAVLQYALGLKRLGHDLIFVEPISAEALRPAGSPLADSDNAAYFRRVAGTYGLGPDAALLLDGTCQTAGLPYKRLVEAARRADILINIAGGLTDERLTESIPVRLYLDLDPAFTQLWQAGEGIDMRFGGHTHFATVGLAVGRAGCRAPTCGLAWRQTLPPVVLAHWPVTHRIEHDSLTTVANWRGYGSIVQGEVVYGQKAHSLREYIGLPALSGESFALALAIHPGEGRDLEALAAHGWRLLDPAVIAATPAAYRRFVQGSRAEFGIAKSGYVISNCGWFSDRSACYLASGRPVVAQDTGFSQFLPTGEGLFAFQTYDDILSALEEIRRNYPRQAQAARQIAEEHFDSDAVLGRLLECN